MSYVMCYSQRNMGLISGQGLLMIPRHFFKKGMSSGFLRLSPEIYSMGEKFKMKNNDGNESYKA